MAQQNAVQKMADEFAVDFDVADKDNSGTLSRREVYEVLRRGGFRGSVDQAQFFFDSIDKNKDDVITRQEFKDAIFKLPRITAREMELYRMFLKMDKDQSGYISSAEVFDAMASQGGVTITKDTINKLFDFLARDEDRKVSYDEFLRALGFEESAHFMNQIFVHMDKDNSGFLTLNEIKSAIESEGELRSFKPMLLKLLDYHEKDADKKISYKEFVESWTSQQKDIRKA